jgi:hypothetical protein
VLPAGLLPHLDGLTVEDVVVVAGGATFTVAGMNAAATCPRCRRRSGYAHSRYRGTTRDLPIGPNIVTFRVHVRRFFCVNRDRSQPLLNYVAASGWAVSGGWSQAGMAASMMRSMVPLTIEAISRRSEGAKGRVRWALIVPHNSSRR